MAMTDDLEPELTALLATLRDTEAAPPEAPGDILARLRETMQTLPEPPQAARVEVGRAVLDRLKAAGRPEGAPPDDRWKPAGWAPPPTPFDHLLGIPVVESFALHPDAWRAIGRDGQVLNEGRL